MPSIFKNKEKRKGMTLIELLVVIAMISIITGVTWVNFRYFGRSFDVERDIGRMAQEVRASLETTMAMEDYDIPVGCTGSDVLVSYGVNFRVGDGFYNKMAYIIDGDNDSPGFGNVTCSEVTETVELDQGAISLIEVFFGASSSSVSELDIIFTPPHPRTYIGSIDVYTVDLEKKWRSEYDAAEISVSLPETSDARTVKVNKAGLIEIIQPGS